MTTTITRAAPPAGPPAPRGRPPARKPPTVTWGAGAIATVALTTLTLAGVFSINRLFSTHAYVGPVLGVALGAHAISWLGRWLRWPPWVSAVVAVVTVGLLTSWLVLGGSTAFGVPTTRTLHAAATAFHQASVDFHSVNAPAPVSTGFLLVTVLVVGLLSVLADWAAFRMQATLEATVPSFTLFVFCAALGSHRSRTAAIAVEVAALLAFVVVHQSTVDQESSAWFANRTQGALQSVVAAGSVIGLAAVIIALNLGFRLPQANAKALVAWRSTDRGGNGTRNTLSPQVDLRGRLLSTTTDPVFTVSSAVPSYWRLTSLDSFDGTNWSALGNYRAVGHHLPAASTATTTGLRVEQDFTIANLTEPWLPAAFEPDTIAGIKGVTYDPQSGSLISDKDTTSGVTYHVSSLVNAGELRPLTLQSAPPPPSGGAMARYLQLPSLPRNVVALAQSIVAGKTTEYDKAVAIQDYLRDPARFSYNLAYDYQGPDPLSHFLFVARQGYCQQFAGSFAVLARLVGLPTRLAYGFSYGNQSAPGVYQVLDDQAHTWPETYFTGVGWVSFEPTPGRGIPGAQAYTNVAPAEASSPGAGATAVPTTATAGQAAPRSTTTTVASSPAAAPVTKSHHRSTLWRLVLWLAGLVGLLIACLGTIWTIRFVRRLVRREAAVGQAADLDTRERGAARGDRWDRLARFRHAWAAEGLTASQAFVARLRAILLLEWLLPLMPWRSPPARPGPGVIARAEMLLTWTEATDLLAWWGIRRYPSETYLELARRAAVALREPLRGEPEAARALFRLAEAGTRGEFDVSTLTAEEMRDAARQLATLRQALLGSATAGQKLRLAIDPRLTTRSR